MLQVHVLPLVFPVGFFTSSHIRLCFILFAFFPLELHRKRPPKTVTSTFQTAVSTLQHVVFSLCTQCSSIKLNLILGYFLGGYVPPGTPNWHPVLEKISPKIDTPF